MQPIILAGGLGTRLRTVVNDRPKVMAEIDGKPFLAYLLYLLKKHGFKEAVISTGYMKEYIQEYFGDSFMGLRLHYCPEETPLGTGGAIEFAFKEIG
ncbi:MAG: D-glycero-D-manno-heptose 1-phosphate guanosyltransferase, partial [Candidatus Dadabacteria bacterium]